MWGTLKLAKQQCCCFVSGILAKSPSHTGSSSDSFFAKVIALLVFKIINVFGSETKDEKEMLNLMFMLKKHYAYDSTHFSICL